MTTMAETKQRKFLNARKNQTLNESREDGTNFSEVKTEVSSP